MKKANLYRAASRSFMETLEERCLLSTATQTTLSVPAPVLLGQYITVTATVTEVGGGPVTSGNVDLFDDGTDTGLSIAVGTNGVALFQFWPGNSIYVGSYQLGAEFMGNATDSTSMTASTYTLTVNGPSLNTTADGLQWATVTAGTGPVTTAGDSVDMLYTGFYQSSGAEFDESSAHSPDYLNYVLGTGAVVSGFDEGTTGMQYGETRVLVLSSALGYNDGQVRVFVVQNVTVDTPQNVVASSGTNSGYVSLTWGATNGAVAYQIFRGPDSNIADATKIGVSQTTSYNDTTAAPGVGYYYFVKGRNPEVVGPTSTAAFGYAALPALANFTTTDNTHHVTLVWGAVSGATVYQIFRSTVNNFSTATKLVGALTTTSYNDVGGTSGVFHYYWVRARNAAGVGLPSVVQDGYIPLPGPGSLTATTNTYPDHVALTWAAVTGAASYQVFRSTDNDFNDATKIGTGITGLTYNDTTATANVLYYYWVRARNALTFGLASGPMTGEES